MSNPQDDSSRLRPGRNRRKRRQGKRRQRTDSSSGSSASVGRKPKVGDVMPVRRTAANQTKPRVDDGRSSASKVATSNNKRRVKSNSRHNKARQKNSRGKSSSAASSHSRKQAGRSSHKSNRKTRQGQPRGRYSMYVHAGEKATHIAVLEGRQLIEYYVSRPHDDVTEIHGNIYLGRVMNVLPGMETAFVDIGTTKNAVLYNRDVVVDSEDSQVDSSANKSRIEDVLKDGQSVLCQVTKNPIGPKGARLVQEISLAGHCVVLIPNSSVLGVSKRLSKQKAEQLRAVLELIQPEGYGLILRTAAENVKVSEIESDVYRLVEEWKRIKELAQRSEPPTLLHREPEAALRLIREEFTPKFRNVTIDDRDLYDSMSDYIATSVPALSNRIKYYNPTDNLPLLERYCVVEQLYKALNPKVWLPSGGSIIIEHTEALTVVDVNTAKNIGKRSLEETVLANNLEAAEELARQLRLRDIGGIIVVDFVDMELPQSREQVIKKFRGALARDKTRTQILDISSLGLVEMTRKRIGGGLLESLSEPCEACSGRGWKLVEDLLN